MPYYLVETGKVSELVEAPTAKEAGIRAVQAALSDDAPIGVLTRIVEVIGAPLWVDSAVLCELGGVARAASDNVSKPAHIMGIS